MSFPPLSADEINNCALPNWYESFKKYTIESKSLSLSTEVLHYLKQDSIFIPGIGR